MHEQQLFEQGTAEYREMRNLAAMVRIEVPPAPTWRIEELDAMLAAASAALRYSTSDTQDSKRQLQSAKAKLELWRSQARRGGLCWIVDLEG